MARSWLIGSLIGVATSVAVTALPILQRGVDANGTKGVPSQAASASQSPSYRFPVGYPVPNPPNLPGHIHPYDNGNRLASSNGRVKGLRAR